MSDGRNRNQDGARRPLLAGGELLTTNELRGSRSPGPKFHPYSLEEAHGLLAPQAERLRHDLDALPLPLRARHVLFEATMHPNYLASSYSPNALLEQAGLYVVGARTGRAPRKTAKGVKEDEPTKTLIVAGAPNAVSSFALHVQAPPLPGAREWDVLREFKDLRLPNPEVVIVRKPDLGGGEVITWEAVLTDIGRTEDEKDLFAEEAFKKWISWIGRLGGEVAAAYRRRVAGLTFVPVALHGEALREAARFNLLRAIRPMPQVRPFPDSIVRAAQRPQPPRAQEPRRPDIVIATFDGGVDASSPYFSPFTSAVDLTPEPADTAYVTHGTLVTSALLYGHVQPGAALPQPTAHVVHYRVLPAPSAGTTADTQLYWILDRIIEAVKRDDRRLVSLSLGPDECVEDGKEPTRWTVELDRLAHELGVTFVAAAGNNGEEDEQFGYNRVQSPADMVNGIGVGACTRVDPNAALQRAPYSAIGPGREGQRVQPTVVSFGGFVPDEPFIGIDASGRLHRTAGTSFSTPVVTRGIADLHGAISIERRRPDIARAFIAHFARRRARGHRAIELGYGRAPDLFDSAWDCAPNTCTILYEQELLRGQSCALRFPLPKGIAAPTEVVIDWTISFTTDVDSRDQVDYTLTGIETVLRPHDRLRTYRHPSNPKEPRVLHVDNDKVEIAQLLFLGWNSSDLPPAESDWRPFRTEKVLRQAGKWETLLRGTLRRAAGKLDNPRLDVTYLRRESGALIGGPDVPPMRLVMVATVRLPEGVALYDLVRAQYRILAPLVTIPIRIATG